MKKLNGFTLVELMVVVSIIGILAGVVYPSYTSYVKKAKCADGIDSLLTLAGFMEEFYMNNDSYEDAAVPTASEASPGGFYELSISEQTAYVYTLKATPVDTEQKTLSLNSLGQKSESGGGGGGAAGPGAEVISCW